MYMDTNEQGEPVWSAHYVMPYGAGEIDLNSPYYSRSPDIRLMAASETCCCAHRFFEDKERTSGT
ncbi:hypothetical protein AB432_014430 [Brevibacillus brevis]|uniref:Uncharacterized protein n=1 Tax=Brevibacillus brevis TaxID=1393 RepID=A0A2Z4MI76_BREBE|nr:hypothetical protein [Brevibacillus brevis]AWX56164.1 hypothetical protein AB432_014430 [Brevibacillus brevis]